MDGLGYDAIANRACGVAQDIALGVLRAWRPDLDGLDALVLMAVSVANTEAMLADPAARRKYGGGDAPLVADANRQPVTAAVLAASHGLPRQVVSRSLAALVAADECADGPDGLVITRAQVAAHRVRVDNQAMYEALREGYWALRTLGFFRHCRLPRAPAPDRSPLRAASAYAGRFALQVLAGFAPLTPDARDALIVLWLLRCDAWSASVDEIAAGTGLKPLEVRRRLAGVAARGLGAVMPEGASLVEGIWSADFGWPARARGLETISMLFVSLAEAGVIADLEASPIRPLGSRRPRPTSPLARPA